MNIERQLSECEGKHRYDTRTQAKNGISNRLKGKTVLYHCSMCTGWHIGGIDVHRQKELAKKRKRQKGSHAAG